VYPDITGKNFGLQALKIGITSLHVENDGDGEPFSDGDWRLWAAIPSTTKPWTRLIDCGGCVEEETYSPTSGIWRSGALARDGTLGEVMLFANQSGLLQTSGFEEDLITSDDTGTVIEGYRGPFSSPRQGFSTCNDQTVANNPVNPSNIQNSGCAEYSIKVSVTPSTTPVTATLS